VVNEKGAHNEDSNDNHNEEMCQNRPLFYIYVTFSIEEVGTE